MKPPPSQYGEVAVGVGPGPKSRSAVTSAESAVASEGARSAGMARHRLKAWRGPRDAD